MPEHAVLVQAKVMIAGRKRNYLVQMLALDPELEFAGCVAGVFATLEHGDDHDLDRESAVRLGQRRCLSTLPEGSDMKLTFGRSRS